MDAGNGVALPHIQIESSLGHVLQCFDGIADLIDLVGHCLLLLFLFHESVLPGRAIVDESAVDNQHGQPCGKSVRYAQCRKQCVQCPHGDERTCNEQCGDEQC